MLLSDIQIIGTGFTTFGLIFMLLGALSPFDSSLIVTGNLFFLSGLSAVMGFDQTIAFLSRRDHLKETVCFVVGILLVFTTLAPIGVAVELFGFIKLFGSFYSMITNFLRDLPYTGAIKFSRYS